MVEPETGTNTYTDGQEPFTTFFSEAEFLTDSGGARVGQYRVAINNTSLRTTRRMAVGITLVTDSANGERRHQINSYYRSSFSHDGATVADGRNEFIPYATVRRNPVLATCYSWALSHQHAPEN